MDTSSAPRTPVSIVCVFNDPEVLTSCLSRSIDAGRIDAPATEFLPIDNRGNPFPTAGAALNHGARAAKNDVVVFVHQDVVLHSLVALECAAAALMSDRSIGMIGAVGIDSHRTIVGRMRDRVVQIGERAEDPRDVDSLDEVLIMMRRDQVLAHPLTEDPRLAWHAYGVEYACRMRRTGLRATALDLAITHNSLTINLDRLDDAHRKIGEDYPDLLPIRTTCGTVAREGAARRFGRTLGRARSAGIWWRESMEARALERMGRAPVIIADVRLVIDDAVALGGLAALRVVDVAAPHGTSADGLTRFGNAYSIESIGADRAPERVAAAAPGEAMLVTGLQRHDIDAIARATHATGVDCILGYWQDTGIWALVGVGADAVAELWSGRRNRPFAGLIGAAGPRR